MIEWGNTPPGSAASIYLPGADADQILNLADQFYGINKLTKIDGHTIQCITGGLTYVPIPAGSGPNLAGLITINLPSTVVAGQEFHAVVRRVSSRFAGQDFAQFQRQGFNWRYVVGAFQINIPVSKSAQLLGPEESILAVYKWKLEQLPLSNRWYPVLQRFIGVVAGRVSGLGGNPGSIPPSLTGFGGGGIIIVPPKRIEYTGKVMGLAFDRFGDFEGFLLLTEEGVEVSFLAREQAIEERVHEAWIDRMVISVFVEESKPEVPVLILLRRAPRR